MNQPDYEGAQRYALERLERELRPYLAYHSLFHTRDDVMPAAVRLAAMEGVEDEDRELLCTAAAFHDIGFVERYPNHEIVGIRIAAEALPRFGFVPAQIQTILDIILVTRLPQTPFTLLEQIMADADLDVLGRTDYFHRNDHLRDELAATGSLTTDAAWYERQLKFLTEHHYFTGAARTSREPKKQQHIEELEALLRALHNGESPRHEE